MNENECNKNCKKNAETWIKKSLQKILEKKLVLLIFIPFRSLFENWACLKSYFISLKSQNSFTKQIFRF